MLTTAQLIFFIWRRPSSCYCGQLFRSVFSSDTVNEREFLRRDSTSTGNVCLNKETMSLYYLSLRFRKFNARHFSANRVFRTSYIICRVNRLKQDFTGRQAYRHFTSFRYIFKLHTAVIRHVNKARHASIH